MLFCSLKQVAEQLGLKYGKKFAHEASVNSNETANQRVSPFHSHEVVNGEDTVQYLLH